MMPLYRAVRPAACTSQEQLERSRAHTASSKLPTETGRPAFCPQRAEQEQVELPAAQRIASFLLTRAALRACRPPAVCKSHDQLERSLLWLKEQGVSDADVARVITRHPMLLCFR